MNTPPGKSAASSPASPSPAPAPIDTRSLPPRRLAMLLNVTPLGEVISVSTLYRHQSRAGLRFGDGKRIDLVRYVAWLFHERRALLAKSVSEADAYAVMKETARQRNASLSAAGRDIGPIPPVADPERRRLASACFRTFCQTYLSATFEKPWSEDHLRVIGKIEIAALQGGQFAMAMPRGSGKTTLCEAATLWAILIAARESVALIGSDEEHAARMLESIKSELENNDLLLADFPEACYPVRCLDGIANRCAGQTCGGQRTQIGWTAKEIVLPCIAGSICSGAVVRVAGLTGQIRGMKHKRGDGRTVRPDLALLDDPQTDESARSPSQCVTREQILSGAILGLAGPGRKIAALMTLTVVRPGDMADRLLDRELHPEWQGERTKMVYSFPTNTELWDNYAQLHADGFRNGTSITSATAFYASNRSAMDQGAKVAWAERYNHDELSAIQHAMNLKLQRGDATFFAEYQNEPLLEQGLPGDLVTAEAIAAKTNAMKRGQVPLPANHLTAFVDVQGALLYWMVVAWEEEFKSGYVIDYGGYPDQQRVYYTLRDATQTLQLAHPRLSFEGMLYAGLQTLTDRLLSREYPRDDGALMRVGRLLVDANWGQSTDIIYRFCRHGGHSSNVIIPSHGAYVGASSRPFDQYTRRPGERVGHHWRIPIVGGRRVVRHVLIDTNYWKSFAHARLSAQMGEPGCLSLFAGQDHRLFGDHLTAEYRVPTEGRGRKVDEWKLKAAGSDNHWLDCLVGCCVAASLCGVVMPESNAAERMPVTRISFAERLKTRRTWGARRRLER